jgi:CheY-like chemotaxis protein
MIKTTLCFMSVQPDRKPRILVADDSRFQLELFRRALEEKGYEVTVAQDALQAGMFKSRMIASGRVRNANMQAGMFALRTLPDAIILDLNMPGGSGIQVLQRLKRSAKTKSIPVMIATGNDDPALQQIATSLGATQFFHKPVDLELLAKTLAELPVLMDTRFIR